MAVGEIFPDEGPIDPRAVAPYLGNGQDELHLAFNFAANTARFDAECFGKILDEAYAAIPAGGWSCHVLSNHDQSRAMTRLALSAPWGWLSGFCSSLRQTSG